MRKPSAETITPRAGSTSAGAKWKIRVMYSRDMREVMPMEKTFPILNLSGKGISTNGSFAP